MKYFPFKFVILLNVHDFLIRLFSFEKRILSMRSGNVHLTLKLKCLNKNGYKVIPGLTSKINYSLNILFTYSSEHDKYTNSRER